MLTSDVMLALAVELTDAQEDGDANSLAAIAWQLYGHLGVDHAGIGRLRAAIHTAWHAASAPVPSNEPTRKSSALTMTT
jgi:hypothetical protein